MKTKLITMAVTAALMPAVAAAQDDVKVYGIGQVEVASFDPQGPDDSYVDVVDNAQGRVGVVATEDLGSGLKGLAKFEFKLDTADGASSNACTNDDCSEKTGVALTGRELLVGLKGGFGQVELGRLKAAYKYAGGVRYDPFVATTLEARKNGGMSAGDFGHTGFLSKSIGYSSPKLGPVDLRATYAPSENDSAYTVSAKAGFKMGEVFVALADQGDRAGTDEYSAWKLGGQLRLAGGAHKISLQYEATENKKANTTKKEPTFVFAGYQGTFGKSTFVAQFGTNDADEENKDKTYYALGAVHKFSKNTRVFGGYRVTDADDDTGESVISIGMRKDFK
jgi:predicted porin